MTLFLLWLVYYWVPPIWGTRERLQGLRKNEGSCCPSNSSLSDRSNRFLSPAASGTQKKKKNGIIASPQNHQHQQGSDNSLKQSNTNKTAGEPIPWLINSKLVSYLYIIIQTVRKHSDVLMDRSHVP